MVPKILPWGTPLVQWSTMEPVRFAIIYYNVLLPISQKVPHLSIYTGINTITMHFY